MQNTTVLPLTVIVPIVTSHFNDVQLPLRLWDNVCKLRILGCILFSVGISKNTQMAKESILYSFIAFTKQLKSSTVQYRMLLDPPGASG